MKCGIDGCQRDRTHGGEHVPFAAEATRLNILERYAYALAIDGAGNLPVITDPLLRALIAAARAAAPFVDHHKQCDPLRTECRCGKWALAEAVREFEERYL